MATWNSRGLRGSTLEDMINRTNERYREKGLALIQKVPTPITPIKIDKEHRHITLAYFDAKECDVTTFPMQNVHEHQVRFMDDFERQGGKAFLIIHFTSEQKFYYLHIRQLLRFWNRAQEGGRKSFRMDELDPAYFFESSKGYLVPFLEPLSLDLEQEQER